MNGDYLFICLFNDAVSRSEYIALTDRIINKQCMVRMWSFQFLVQCFHLSGGT